MVSKKSNLKSIPIARPYLNYQEETLILETMRSRWISQGAKVEEFENKVTDYVGAKYAIATSSGTTALHVALLVLGIGKGDEVIIPSFSFIATANSIRYCGANPVFIDIDAETYNIDPEKIKQFIREMCNFDSKKRILFNKKTHARIKAIMPVHQFGLVCDMDKIFQIARTFNLAIVEDAACALGSKYKNKMIGSISKITCFSFHPRKVVTTGEGGMIVTNDRGYAEKARALRNHGTCPSSGNYAFIGYNYRLSDLHAAIGLAQMSKLPEILQRRRSLARYYDKVFRRLSYIQIPYIPFYATPNYQSYVIQFRRNTSLTINKAVKELIKQGISVRPGNTAIHLQSLYKKKLRTRRSCFTDLPNTEKLASYSLALPIFPEMTRKEQDYVIDRVISLAEK